MELWLLVELEHGVEVEPSSVLDLDERQWILTKFANSREPIEEKPDYACISYIWGSERIGNPYRPEPKEISTNTIPSLVAAMQNTQYKAFWIDAFCIPTIQPRRHSTLESMGFIYNQATEVRVILSKDSFIAVQQLATGNKVDDESLDILDKDEWVSSVWTYQEVVNSQRLKFTCPGALGVSVDGSQFLNHLGYNLDMYKKANGLDSFAIREKFPSLDAFEDLIADWMISDYTKRSVFAVMTNLDRRVFTDERNYFYAMIGAITDQARLRSRETEVPDLSEALMAICEAKKDFSFIYSSCSRSSIVGKTWRPRSGQLLPSILPWHSWGESQPGHFDEGGSLWLDSVIHFQQQQPLSSQAKEIISKWLHRDSLLEADDSEIAEIMYKTLVRIGFTGSKDYLSVGDGLIFYQDSSIAKAEPNVNVDIYVSSTIRWVFGAPGIACRSDETDGSLYTSFIFCGVLDDPQVRSIRLR